MYIHLGNGKVRELRLARQSLNTKADPGIVTEWVMAMATSPVEQKICMLGSKSPQGLMVEKLFLAVNVPIKKIVEKPGKIERNGL